MDFMSGTLSSDLGDTRLSEDDEEEEEERYAVVSKNLCGFEYTPGHSMDNLEVSGMQRAVKPLLVIMKLWTDNTKHWLVKMHLCSVCQEQY